MGRSAIDKLFHEGIRRRVFEEDWEVVLIGGSVIGLDTVVRHVS